MPSEIVQTACFILKQQAFAAGFQAVKLGPRVLRTETAALAAIAAMQVLWGDFV